MANHPEKQTAIYPLKAGTKTTVGGAAAESFTISDLKTTDIPIVTLKAKGSTPRTILTATISATNTLTITFSGDPSTDHTIVYVIYRQK